MITTCKYKINEQKLIHREGKKTKRIVKKEGKGLRESKR